MAYSHRWISSQIGLMPVTVLVGAADDAPSPQGLLFGLMNVICWAGVSCLGGFGSIGVLGILLLSLSLNQTLFCFGFGLIQFLNSNFILELPLPLSANFGESFQNWNMWYL